MHRDAALAAAGRERLAAESGAARFSSDLTAQRDAPLAVTDLAEGSEPVIKKIIDAHGEFNHALPAHELTRSMDEFYAQVRPATLKRFEALVASLLETIPAHG